MRGQPSEPRSVSPLWLLIPAPLGLPVLFQVTVDATRARGLSPTLRHGVVLGALSLALLIAAPVQARAWDGVLLAVSLLSGLLLSTAARRVRRPA